MTTDRSGAPFTWIVEQGKITEFAAACTDQNPAHRGPDAVAPPTFPQAAVGFWEDTTTRPQPDPPFDHRRVLHGEQEFEYVRPLRAGDVLTGQSRLKELYEKEGKRGGTMRFAVFETTFTDASGEPVAWSRATVLETAKPTTE